MEDNPPKKFNYWNWWYKWKDEEIKVLSEEIEVMDKFKSRMLSLVSWIHHALGVERKESSS